VEEENVKEKVCCFVIWVVEKGIQTKQNIVKSSLYTILFISLPTIRTMYGKPVRNIPLYIIASELYLFK